MSLWKSNLILSEIPWDYYLHPCPKFYAKELANYGSTIWVNPPTRNPFRLGFKKKNNLIVFTPFFFKRNFQHAGFPRLEVRLQIRILVLLFSKKVSSVWSISTAYPHLIKDFSPAISIFWSGDFFRPIQEYKTYKNFNLLLCLTPKTYDEIPKNFSGQKCHFNMCCDLDLFKSKENTFPPIEFSKVIKEKKKYSKVIGYVGTLSARRFDFELFLEITKNLSEVLFVVVGKSDGLPETESGIAKMLSSKNISFINGLSYNKLPAAIAFFDICLIPYKTDEANIGTCPTKLIDYCAMGKPVFSTKLPGVEKFGKLVNVELSSKGFVDALRDFDPKADYLSEKRMELAQSSSPRSFIKKFEALIP